MTNTADAAKKTTKPAKPKTTKKPRPQSALIWSPCIGAVECTDLRVPINPADAALGTTRIGIGRILARDPKTRRGVLFVNPGGPGGSAVQLVASIANARVRGPLGSGFDDWDVVGVDPRGVGRSEPIRCGSKPTDLGVDPFNTKGSDQERARVREEFFAACLRKTGPMFFYAGTVDMADDLDRVRVALGESEVDYLGYSYGTAVGAAYAARYGFRVKSMVLDAPIDPAQYGAPFLTQWASAKESRVYDFAQACANSQTCAFRTETRNSPETIVADIQNSLRTIDAKFGPQQALIVRSYIASALEESADWSTAGKLLALIEVLAKVGPGATAPQLPPSDSYDLLSDPLFWANSCADGRFPLTAEAFASAAQTITANSPIIGVRDLSIGDLCIGFPARPVPSNVSTAAKPTLIIGGTKDSRTPAIWATGLGTTMGNAVVVFRDGDGHASYNRSACVRRMVEAYLVRNEIPASGTICANG